MPYLLAGGSSEGGGGGGAPAALTMPAVGEYVVTSNQGTTSNTMRFVEGRVYYIPLEVSVAMTVDAASFFVASSNQSGGTLRAGVYGVDDRNLPGALLGESGAVATAAGTKDAVLASPLALEPGMYYVGIYAEALLGSTGINFWGSDETSGVHVGHRSILADLENKNNALFDDGHTGSALPAAPSPSQFSAVVPLAALRRSA